jgi:hypothetical protein
VDWPVCQIRDGEEKDLWLQLEPPLCDKKKVQNKTPRVPGGRLLHKVSVRQAEKARRKLLELGDPCQLHIKVTTLETLLSLGVPAFNRESGGRGWEKDRLNVTSGLNPMTDFHRQLQIDSDQICLPLYPPYLTKAQ